MNWTTGVLIGVAVILSLFFNSAQGAATRVIGGDKAPHSFGRFHASLQNLTGHHVCGGAVISEKHVITAAHCVDGAHPEYIKVVVGTTNLDVAAYQHDVLSIHVYTDFDFGSRTNDLAILKVVGEFDLQNIEILELDEEELSVGDDVILSGFGAQLLNGEMSRVLQALSLPVFDQETCKFAMRYTREVCDTMFCTFTQIGEGTCHGDSGSPLIKGNKLVGVVSWGIPCAVGFPDVHTRIIPYLDWIKAEIQK